MITYQIVLFDLDAGGRIDFLHRIDITSIDYLTPGQLHELCESLRSDHGAMYADWKLISRPQDIAIDK